MQEVPNKFMRLSLIALIANKIHKNVYPMAND
jgi:hypothetical protein